MSQRTKADAGCQDRVSRVRRDVRVERVPRAGNELRPAKCGIPAFESVGGCARAEQCGREAECGGSAMSLKMGGEDMCFTNAITANQAVSVSPTTKRLVSPLR